MMLPRCARDAKHVCAAAAVRRLSVAKRRIVGPNCFVNRPTVRFVPVRQAVRLGRRCRETGFWVRSVIGVRRRAGGFGVRVEPVREAGWPALPSEGSGFVPLSKCDVAIIVCGENADVSGHAGLDELAG